MNSISRSVRNVGRLAKEKQTYRSALMVTLNKCGQVTVGHPMDTNLGEYRRVMNEIVIPDCLEFVPDKDYTERMRQVINYTHPSFNECWNFSAEHVYRVVAPEEHQTEENLTKARILRACSDLMYNMSAVLDDLCDKSTVRMGKPSWHTFCDGGPFAGMYDALAMGMMPFHVLRKHFGNDPGYVRMLEMFGTTNLKMFIGQIIDHLLQNKFPVVSKEDTGINTYKAGQFFVFQPLSGLIHAGVMDNDLLKKAKDVYIEFGDLIQAWDDYNDYYRSMEETGKPPMDNRNGGKLWAVVKSIQHFNSRQLSLLKECYLSTDPEKRDTVKKLMDEIDLSQLYINHMREAYLRIQPMIQAIPHARIQKACYSHMEWFIGDVCDPLPTL